MAESFPEGTFQGKKVLLIVPDSTRTAPVGWMFQTLFKLHGKSAAAMDVMIALGTHQPMSEEAICQRLEISLEERKAPMHPFLSSIISGIVLKRSKKLV